MTDVLKEMFTAVFIEADYSEEKLARYFSRDYVQHVDGKTIYFEQFVQHIKAVREATVQTSFDFKTVIAAGNVVFSNHVVKAVMKDGREVSGHVIGEFRFNEEGKVCYCDELTNMTSGEEGDRDLGSRY